MRKKPSAKRAFAWRATLEEYLEIRVAGRRGRENGFDIKSQEIRKKSRN